MSRARRLITVVLALLVTAAALPAGPVRAEEAVQPYEHEWFAESMVGGDRGGESSKSVLESAATMTEKEGAYEGTVTYADRLAVLDAAGQMLIQVSSVRLKLIGARAAGGSAIAGTFTGTITLDEYRANFEQGTSGELPAKPAGSSSYAMTGHWGARLSGSGASGEIEYESATMRSKSGEATPRDLPWFVRPDGGAQTFEVQVVGTAPSETPADGSPGVLDAIRRGLAGGPAKPKLAIPAELAARARALRDARPEGATPLPDGAICIDIDVAGHVLDAKNRAAGLNGASGTGAVKDASFAWHGERNKPAGEISDDALLAALEAQKATPGAELFLDDVRALIAAPPSAVPVDAPERATELLAAVRSLVTAHVSVMAATA